VQKHRVEVIDSNRKSLEMKQTFAVFNCVAAQSMTKVAQELQLHHIININTLTYLLTYMHRDSQQIYAGKCGLIRATFYYY